MNDVTKKENDGSLTIAESIELAKTPAELRAYFVNKAKPRMDEYIWSALGTSELSSNNNDARNETWGLLRDIINSAGNITKLDAENTHDVITMLKDGKISIQDAKALMDMLSIKSDMDDVKKLLEAVTAMNNGTLTNG